MPQQPMHDSRTSADYYISVKCVFSRWKFIYFFYRSASEGRNGNSNCKLLACTHTPLIFNFCKVCKRTVAAAVISLELAFHLNIYIYIVSYCSDVPTKSLTIGVKISKWKNTNRNPIGFACVRANVHAYEAYKTLRDNIDSGYWNWEFCVHFLWVCIICGGARGGTSSNRNSNSSPLEPLSHEKIAFWMITMAVGATFRNPLQENSQAFKCPNAQNNDDTHKMGPNNNSTRTNSMRPIHFR